MVALVACSGSKGPEHPTQTPDAGSGTQAGSQSVADAPNASECDALFVHTVKLSGAERPADQQMNEAEQRKVLADMRADASLAAKCRAMTRARFTCALQAPNLAAIKACDG